MSGVLEMPDEYRKVLYTKFTIVGHFNFLEFDSNFPLLETWLAQLKKDHFASTDRIIIEHMDTDYYVPDFPYGFYLHNLITAFKAVDIPLFTLLLFTNHFGIEQELKSLLPHHNQYNQPTVISSFISTLHYSTKYINHDINIDAISIPGISLMNNGRVHRDVFASFINNNNLLDVVATVYHNK